MNAMSTRSPIWKVAAFAALLSFITLLYIGLWRDPSYIPSAQIGQSAKAFSLPRLQGDGYVNLADYRGKWIVLNFWASWCGACRQEHDLLVEVGKRFSGDQRIALVGVNFRDGREAAMRFLQREGAFPYPSGHDLRGRVGIDFGVYGLPETFFIDPEGKLYARHVGVLSERVLTANLRGAFDTPSTQERAR